MDDRLLLLNAALVTVRDGGLDRLGPDGQLFLEAVRRSKNDLANASPEAIGDYLREFDEEQLRGVVSNVKGIAHEMMVAEAENSDGDTVFAELYPDTNHPTFDLMLTDVATGEQLRPRQVKATDSAADALDWKELNPGSDLAVSSELAARTGLPSTGFSNTEMTADVEDLFERLSDTPSLWDAFPWLLLASTSVSVVTRVRGHPFDEPIGRALVKLTAVTLGRKATKMGSLLFLLSLPVIGAFTGAVIALRVLLALRKLTVTEDRARARRGPSLEAFHA